MQKKGTYANVVGKVKQKEVKKTKTTTNNNDKNNTTNITHNEQNSDKNAQLEDILRTMIETQNKLLE